MANTINAFASPKVPAASTTTPTPRPSEGPQAAALPVATSLPRDSFKNGADGAAPSGPMAKALALPEGKSWSDYVHVEVTTSPVSDSSLKANMRASNIGVTVENANLRNLLSDMGLESYAGVDTVMSTTLRVSGVPTALKGSVQDELGEKVDTAVAEGFALIEKTGAAGHQQVAQAGAKLKAEMEASLAAQKPAALQAAEAQAVAAVSATSTYQTATPELQQAMAAQAKAQAAAGVDAYFAQLRAQYTAKIDAGLAEKDQAIDASVDSAKAGATAAGEAKKKEISRRLDKLKVETSFQEVSLLMGKPVSGGTALVWLKAGKFAPETVGPENRKNQTSLDALRPVNSVTQGGVRTASTGAVDLGTSVIVGKGKKVQANVMFVHDRPPFIDGKDYIGTVVSMSPKDFDEHQAFYKINSVIGRAMFATDAGNIHATVGSFNGKIQGELGADWKLTKATSVIADATLGKRSSLKEGASAFVAHEVNPGFTIYAGAEYLKGQLLRSASARADGTVDSTKVVAGAKKNVYSYDRGGVHVGVHLGVEAQHYTQKKDYTADSDGRNDVQVGVTVNATWR